MSTYYIALAKRGEERCTSTSSTPRPRPRPSSPPISRSLHVSTALKIVLKKCILSIRFFNLNWKATSAELGHASDIQGHRALGCSVLVPCRSSGRGVASLFGRPSIHTSSIHPFIRLSSSVTYVVSDPEAAGPRPPTSAGGCARSRLTAHIYCSLIP